MKKDYDVIKKDLFALAGLITVYAGLTVYERVLRRKKSVEMDELSKLRLVKQLNESYGDERSELIWSIIKDGRIVNLDELLDKLDQDVVIEIHYRFKEKDRIKDTVNGMMK